MIVLVKLKNGGDTENALLELQDEIKTHIGWKLENCYKPSNNEIQDLPTLADICTPSGETTDQADVIYNQESGSIYTCLSNKLRSHSHSFFW